MDWVTDVTPAEQWTTDFRYRIWRVGEHWDARRTRDHEDGPGEIGSAFRSAADARAACDRDQEENP